MIFCKRYECKYRRWFAWHPVRLRGPDEWDRQRALNVGPRLVWMRMIWRMKTRPKNYYALPGGDHE